MHSSDHRFPPGTGPRDDDRFYIQEWRNLTQVATAASAGVACFSRGRLRPARKPPFIAYNQEWITGSIAGYSFASQGIDETCMHDDRMRNADGGYMLRGQRNDKCRMLNEGVLSDLKDHQSGGRPGFGLK